MENALHFSACIYATFMGIFLKLTAVLGHALCQQKEKKFVLFAAEYRCLPFGPSPGYVAL